jgi:hypothetical protein
VAVVLFVAIVFLPGVMVLFPGVVVLWLVVIFCCRVVVLCLLCAFPNAGTTSIAAKIILFITLIILLCTGVFICGVQIIKVGCKDTNFS